MYDALSDIKKIANFETSFAFPNLLRGMLFNKLSFTSSERFSVMFVDMYPGEIEFMFIPLEPSSVAGLSGFSS